MRPARRLAGVLAGVLLLASCTAGRAAPAADAPTSGSPAASSGPTDDGATPAAPRPPRAPEDGACYRLPFDAAAEPTSSRPPVDCRRRHYAQTIHVGTLVTVLRGHALAVDSDRVVAQLDATCPRRLAQHVGGSVEDRRLSRLRAVWFAPTLEQSDRGARWYRCDVVAVAARDRLFPLPPPRQLRGLLDDPGRAAPYALCGTTAPGDPHFARVACGRPHRWRAVATIDLPGGRRYPGAAAVRAGGDDDCRDRVRARAADPLRFRYGWEWPTREQWLAGQHHGFCWAPD